MLTVIIYLIVSTGIPNMYSQVVFLIDFISEEMTLGQEGYALATFETAVKGLISPSFGGLILDLQQKRQENVGEKQTTAV